MFRPAYVRLQGVGPFKDQKLTFSKGLTTIYGLNLGAGNSVTNTNAAGKSALVSSIYETLFETPLSNIKSDRIKPGRHVFGFYVGDEKYTLIRKGSSAELRTDGKSYTGVLRVRRKLESILPILPEDYTTFIHLDSQLSHPLVKGTNAQRKAFFTSFFDQVMDLDAEKVAIKTELAKITKECAHGAQLQDQIKALTAVVLDEDSKSLLRKELRELKSQYMALKDVASNAKAYQNYREFVLRYSKVLPLIKGDLDGAIAKFGRIVAKMQKAEDQYHKYQGYIEAKAAYNDWLESIPQELQVMLENGARLEDFKSSIEEAAMLEMRLEQIKTELQQLVPTPEPNKGKKGDSEALKLEIASIESRLKHRHDGSICTECGQKTIKQSKEYIDRLRAQLDSLRLRLTQSLQHEKWLEYRKLEDDRILKRTQLIKESKSLADRFARADKYRTFSDFLYNKPLLPKKVNPVKYDKGRHRRAEDIYRQLCDIAKHGIPEKVQAVEFDSRSFEAIIKRRIQIQDALSKSRDNAEALESLRAQYHQLQVKMERKNKLEQLLQAYDDKAVKRMIIEAISEQLMTIVNNESHFISGEDFRFGFEWKSNQVALTVQRFFNGKPTETTDVRQLSGAESKLYTLTLMMALMHFVPENRRSYVLILDEPNAHFGEDSEQRFRNLLQKLQTVIPSILIITPRLDRYGGRELTVLKRNGEAKIVDGHPKDLQ